MGKWGKAAVNINLAGSQIGFVCAYVYFLKNNFADFCNHYFGTPIEPARYAFAGMCLVVFSLLCFVEYPLMESPLCYKSFHAYFILIFLVYFKLLDRFHLSTRYRLYSILGSKFFLYNNI